MKRSFYRMSGIAAAAIAICMMFSSCSTVTDLFKGGLDGLFTSETTTVSETQETTPTTPVSVVSSSADTTVSAAQTNDVEQNEKGTGLKEIISEGKLSDDSNHSLFRSAKSSQQIVSTTYDGKKLSQNFYLYRNQLSGDELKAYDTLYEGLLKGQKSIPLNVPIKENQLDKILFYIRYDRPELFWIDLSYEYYYNNSGNITDLEMQYNSLAKDIKGNTEKLEKSVSKVVDAMAALPNDIERAKYAHDYLTYSIDYVENDLDQVAYSALVQKKTVCAGYSQAFTYLMHKMGIQCAVVSGHAGEAHAWCKVILDGDCYAMDVTWDDPEGNPPNVYYYDYFNVTDRAMSSDHTIDSISAGLPVANGTKASFANYFRGTQYGTDFGDGNAPVSGYDYDYGNYNDNGYNWNNNYDFGGYTTSNYNWNYDWDWDYDYGNYTTTSYNWNNNFSNNTTTTYNWNNYYSNNTTTTYNWNNNFSNNTTTSYNWNYDWDWDYDYGNYTTTSYNWNNNYGNNTTTSYNWNYDWDDWDYDYGGYSSYDYGWDDDWNWDDLFGYYDNSSSSYSSDWWNYFDTDWKKSDWEYDSESGFWTLYDDTSGCCYVYDPTDGTYYCLDPYDNFYIYDASKDDWDLCDD